MQKTTFRKNIINERLSLDGKEVLKKSDAIERRLLELSLYKNAGSIAMYSDCRGEVKTDLILRDALASGKTVIMPKTGKNDFLLSFFSIFSEGELKENAMGFKEPFIEKGRKWEVEDIDLFIVPGVAFDTRGNRLGMGKGCYDRALGCVKRETIVALSYEFQMVEEVPSYHHDVRVGWIVTEKRLIRTMENN